MPQGVTPSPSCCEDNSDFSTLRGTSPFAPNRLWYPLRHYFLPRHRPRRAAANNAGGIIRPIKSISVPIDYHIRDLFDRLIGLSRKSDLKNPSPWKKGNIDIVASPSIVPALGHLHRLCSLQNNIKKSKPMSSQRIIPHHEKTPSPLLQKRLYRVSIHPRHRKTQKHF